MKALFPSGAVVGLLAMWVIGHGDGREVAPRPRLCSDFQSRYVMDSDGFIAYVEAPQIAKSAGETFIIGYPSFAINAAGMVYGRRGPHGQMIAGAKLLADGSTAFLPVPTDSALANPRVVTDPRGRLNLLWVDADSIGDAKTEMPIVWSVWSGGKWSEPDSIAGTSRLDIWGPTRVSPPIQSDSETSLVATFGVAGSRTREIVWQRGRWTARRMPQFSQPYLNLEATADTVLAAYVDYGEPDGNAVFVQRSVDKGKTFGPPLRVSPPGTGFALDVRLLKSGKQLIVVWVARLHGVADIRATVSMDGGVGWRDQPALQAGSDIAAFRAASTTNGKVVAIAQFVSGDKLMTNYVEWRDGVWSKPMPLLRDSTASLGKPAVVAMDSVTMAWGEYQPRDKAPKTRIMTLPVDCVL